MTSESNQFEDDDAATVLADAHRDERDELPGDALGGGLGNSANDAADEDGGAADA